MPGCDSAAVRRASTRKRSRKAWSPANSHLHRLGLGAGGERDRLVSQHLRVDIDPRADQGTERWQGTKLVAGEVATQLLLRRQASMVVTDGLADQVQIQATRGGDDHQ